MAAQAEQRECRRYRHMVVVIASKLGRLRDEFVSRTFRA
jgi:hypothetical protein